MSAGKTRLLHFFHEYVRLFNILKFCFWEVEVFYLKGTCNAIKGEGGGVGYTYIAQICHPLGQACYVVSSLRNLNKANWTSKARHSFLFWLSQCRNKSKTGFRAKKCRYWDLSKHNPGNMIIKCGIKRFLGQVLKSYRCPCNPSFLLATLLTGYSFWSLNAVYTIETSKIYYEAWNFVKIKIDVLKLWKMLWTF